MRVRVLPTEGGESLAKDSLEDHWQQAVAAVSGDRLAQIEERIRDAREFPATNWPFDPADVRALVEIAKAAREVNKHALCPQTHEELLAYADAHVKLAAALARLDSGAA